MAELAQVLVMMAIPASVLLVFRHQNRRDDRRYSQNTGVDEV